MKPNISIKDNCSLRNIQAIIAEVVGIKKNTVTVLLAELFLIKNINIVNAPKDTRKPPLHSRRPGTGNPTPSCPPPGRPPKH